MYYFYYNNYNLNDKECELPCMNEKSSCLRRLGYQHEKTFPDIESENCENNGIFLALFKVNLFYLIKLN